MSDAREEIELHPAVGELVVKMRADLVSATARAEAAESALQRETGRHEETLAAVRKHLAAIVEQREADALVAMTPLNSPDREAVWQRYLAAFDRTEAAEASLRSVIDRVELEALRKRLKEQSEQQAGVDKMFEETERFIRQHEGDR